MVGNDISDIGDYDTDENTEIYLSGILLNKNKVYLKLIKDRDSLLRKYKKDIYKLCNYAYADDEKINNCLLSMKIPNEYSHLNVLIDKIKSAKNYFQDFLIKMGIRRGGISANTVIDALYALKKWKGGSVKIPKPVRPAINTLTVTSDIPDKIYRGFVLYDIDAYDEKELDQYGIDKKYLKKLLGDFDNGIIKKGDKIKYSFGNVTAWSTSIYVADTFASMPTRSAKYVMVVSYKPKKEDIIADLRDIDITSVSDYHHELELILTENEYYVTIEKLSKVITKTDDDLYGKPEIDMLRKGGFYQKGGIYQMSDMVLQALSLNKYTNIKDPNVIKEAERIVKSDKTYDDFIRYTKSYFNLTKSKNFDLDEIHPRIAATILMYCVANREKNKLSNDFIKIVSLNLDTMDIYSIFGDMVKVKFNNYNMLFRKLGYDIIKITENKKSNDHENVYVNGENIEDSIKNVLYDVINKDYSKL